MITTQKAPTLVAVAIPIVAFGVPLLDTLIAIVRRYLRHEPIFAPDRGHIHHRLRDLGLSSRGVAVMLYIACAGCASLSMALAAPRQATVVPVFLVAGAVLLVVVQRLRVPELTELSRVVHRGFQQRAVISHNVRVHGLKAAIEESRDADGFVQAFRDAFAGSEFSSVELWVPSGPGLIEADGVRVVDDGVLMRLDFGHVLHPGQEYEIRLPLWDDDEQVGRLSLRRPTTGRRLYTDVRLIALELTPAIGEALGRMPSPAVRVVDAEGRA